MTPNEARWSLEHNYIQAKRNDVLGKVARQEMKEAHIVLAWYALEVAQRMRAKQKRRAYLETAAYHRQAAYNLENWT
jgi:hypothetical protein